MTIVKLFVYTIFKINDWGLYWVALGLSLTYLPSSKIKQMFTHLIVSFFVLRVLLYTFFDGIVDASSGNRMMIHIFFIGLFIIFYSLFNNKQLNRKL